MNYVSQVVEKLDIARFNNIKVVQNLAAQTKQKPEYISLALLSVILIFFLLTGIGHKILLLLLTFLYPAYKSFVSLETESREDDKRWLTYWIVFGFVFAFKNVFWGLLSLFPGVNLILALGLTAVYSPLTNGYLYVNDFVFKPAVKAYNTSFSKYVDMAKEEAADKLNKSGKGASDKRR